MGNIENKRYWNIVKGVSITSIVIGHCCHFLVPFVYLYHLAIFFFVAGYFYNEKKYGDDPYLYFLAKIKANWKKFVIYTTFFILIHNFLYNKGMIINTNVYYIKDMIQCFINTLMFCGTEAMGGAMWFVPVYIIASSIFGIIIFYSRKISTLFKSNTNLAKNVLIIYATLFIGFVGVYLNRKEFLFIFHAQTAFLVIPFFTIGYFVRNYCDNVFKYLKIWIFIPVMLLLGYFAYKQKIWINLSDNIIGNDHYFYLISIFGFYFCLYLSKILFNIKFIKNGFDLIGKYSFEIMASHFFIFKIIDYIYARIQDIVDPTVYGVFPYAFKNLWLIYILLGIIIPVITFYLFDKFKAKILENIKEKNYIEQISSVKDKFVDKFIKIIKDKKFIILMALLFLLTFSLPILKLGIMHNDELMSRFWSMNGFKKFYMHYFNEQLQKGRALSCFIIPFTMYLGFIGKSTYMFKFFQSLSIIICAITFGVAIYKILKNKKVAIFSIMLFLGFLPITFEPTVPSVFVTFYNVSVFLLLISLMLYNNYLETAKLRSLIFSMIILFFVELSYEAFVTYVPLYLLLYLYRKGIKNLFKDIKGWILPILVGITYLVLYIIASKVFPSNYDGNKIDKINLLTSFNIIYYIARYSLPGCYIFSDKYNYLYNVYYRVNLIDIIRTIIMTLIFGLGIIVIFIKNKYNSKIKEEAYDKKSILKVVFFGICAIVLPILPISVATMYQKMDIGIITVALPVTFFSYFGAILIYSFLIYFLIERFDLAKYLVIPILLLGIIKVQNMNNVISIEANNNYNRLLKMESFVESDFFEENNIKEIYAPDLFITKNTLAIHDGYWNEFARFKGKDICIKNEVGNSESTNLYFLEEDECFEVIKDNTIYIISKEDIDRELNINLNEKEKIKTEISDECKIIREWKIYTLNMSEIVKK